MNYNSMYFRFGVWIIAALLSSVALFAFLQSTGKTLLDSYYVQSGYLKKENNRRLEAFQTFINKEDVSILDTDKIAAWVKEQSVVSLQIYKGEVLQYDSDYPEGESMPEFSISGNYEDYEAYHLVKFADQEGYVFLTGYYNQQLYNGITVGSILLSALLLIGVVMLQVHKVIRYICILNREIQILESGDLEYAITVQGKDELASMAVGLNSMRQSLREQMAEKEEAVRLNGKIITEMSHELRTPLTALMVYIDILRSNKQWDAGVVTEYVNKIEQKAKEITALADHIIDHSLEDKSVVPEQSFEDWDADF